MAVSGSSVPRLRFSEVDSFDVLDVSDLRFWAVGVDTSSGKNCASSSLFIMLDSLFASFSMSCRILACRFLGLILPSTETSALGVGFEAAVMGFSRIRFSFFELSSGVVLLLVSWALFSLSTTSAAGGVADTTEVALDALLDLWLKISVVFSRIVLFLCALVGYPPGLSPLATAPDA